MNTKEFYSDLKFPKLQPRGGRSTISKQQVLWEALEQGGADVLPLTIDSRTRLGQFKEAEELYQLAKVSGTETLNGFPLLNASDRELNELFNSTSLPVSLRHGTPKPFDLISRALKFGVNEIEGGPLTYTLPYSRDVSLKESIENWSKSELECRRYFLNSGNEIIRESFGVLTACLVPPIQAIFVGLLEAAFTLSHNGGIPMIGFGDIGCEYQNVASVQTFKKLLPWWLELLNINSESATLIAFHHWMGPFPLEKSKSLQIMKSGTITSLNINADKLITKTFAESLGVPTPSQNRESLQFIKNTMEEYRKSNESDDEVEEISEESFYLEKELKIQLMELANESDGIKDLLLKSVELGFVDPPFAPHRSCRRQLRTLRAEDKSVRITSDFTGRCSKNFINRETLKLNNISSWSLLNSDKISEQISWPKL